MTTAFDPSSDNEVAILARVFVGGNGQVPGDLARAILEVKISARDRARMHDLATRNEADALTADEKAEMRAFGKAATLLSILKSKARRTLGTGLSDPNVY